MQPGVQIACAVVWNLVAAGPVFGFAALKPVLVAQGVYRGQCSPEETACTAQDLKLNLMFTIAAAVTNFVAIIVGFILDTKGPRVCGFIGSGFLALGALFLGNSASFSSIDPYVFGYTCLAIGGPFVFISTFQLANAVPQHSGKILAALTGAFDTSSALFMIYRIIYQKLEPVSLHTFFTIYLVVPLFIVLCQLFVMPRTSYRSLGAVHKLQVEGLDEDGNLPDGVDASRIVGDEERREEVLNRHMSQSRIGDRRPSSRVAHVSDTRRRSVLEDVVAENLRAKSDGVYGIMHGKTAREQLKSRWFGYILVLTVVCMLRLNYFMATVRSQEEYLLGDAARAEQVGAIFDIALPLGGLVAIPMIGLILDNVSTINVLKLMSLVSVAVGVLGLFPSFYANVFGILLLVLYRPFYYTVVSDYCSKVFGFETFGTVYGLLISVSGLLNLLQTVVDHLTHVVFKMDPTPMNTLLTATTAVTAALLLNFASKAARKARRASEHTALLDDSAIID